MVEGSFISMILFVLNHSCSYRNREIRKQDFVWVSGCWVVSHAPTIYTTSGSFLASRFQWLGNRNWYIYGGDLFGNPSYMGCPCNDANVWRLFYKIDPPQEMWSLGTWNIYGQGQQKAMEVRTISTKFVSFPFRLSVKYLVVTVISVCLVLFCLPKKSHQIEYLVQCGPAIALCRMQLFSRLQKQQLHYHMGKRGRSTSLPLEQLACLYLCTPAMAVLLPINNCCST